MKTKNTLVVMGISMALLTACKKDKKKPADPIDSGVNNSYTQLTVGNYWIYEEYDVDSTGYGVATGVYDSAYIEKDTLIDGKTYFKKIESNMPFAPHHAVYLRDSSHYLVDHHGRILFAAADFTTTFQAYAIVIGPPADTVATVTEKMTDQNLSLTVQAGTFATSNFQQLYHMYPAHNSSGTLRSVNQRYSEGVGQVVHGLPFFSATPLKKELRLVRYHIN